MPDNKVRLSDYGLQSERLLWPRNGPAGRGPSVFEDEVAALERRLGLTTFGKLWYRVRKLGFPENKPFLRLAHSADRVLRAPHGPPG